jgi:hypothetical protein
MNLPRGRAPVFRVARSNVLGFFVMTNVKIKPTFKLNPVPNQLRLQRLFRPIHALRRGPLPEFRRYLEHHVFAFLHTIAPRDQNVNVTITETVRGFNTRIRNVDHLPLNPAGAIR